VTFPVASPQPDHPARLILILSLAPTVGLGIGHFACSLVLPDMRDALGWSYSAAGFMNTVNAAGYLAGALTAARLITQAQAAPPEVAAEQPPISPRAQLPLNEL
jgi:predicted MFS family arabinose efflux permease